MGLGILLEMLVHLFQCDFALPFVCFPHGGPKSVFFNVFFKTSSPNCEIKVSWGRT